MDHHAHFERLLEAHYFIVVEAISLKIGSLYNSGLLFLNQQLELSYEIWIKSYMYLITGFLSGSTYLAHFDHLLWGSLLVKI